MEAAEVEPARPRWQSLLGDAAVCLLLGAMVGFALADGAEAVAISVGLAFPAGVLLALASWAEAREGLRGPGALVGVGVSLGCTLIVVAVGTTFFPVAVGWGSLDDRWPQGLALGVMAVGFRLWDRWRDARGNPHPDDRRVTQL